MPDLYEILGVARDADADAIKRAHRKLAKQHHPDRGGDPEAFKSVQQAYDVLIDPILRAKYDETGIIPDSPAAAEAERLLDNVMLIFDKVVGAIDDFSLDGADLVARMLVEVDRAKERGRLDISAEEKKKRRAEKLITRIGRKDGAKSPIVERLRARIAAIEGTIRQMQKGLADLEASRLFILEHKSPVAGGADARPVRGFFNPRTT